MDTYFFNDATVIYTKSRSSLVNEHKKTFAQSLLDKVYMYIGFQSLNQCLMEK